MFGNSKTMTIYYDKFQLVHQAEFYNELIRS